MKRKLIFIILIILCLCLVFVVVNSVNSNDNEDNNSNYLIINLPNLGIIKGSITYTVWSQSIIYQFLGIPFAESPSNGLRFKSPVPREPWNNIRSAMKHGRPCPNTYELNKLQVSDDDELQDDLEDCLNIAVYTKNIKANNPVMVYIHGGGFYNGSAFDHPPNYLLEENIVLVVPEYRLGILGFMSTKSDEIPGNAAVLDLILALQWVQKYIEHFGGDPKNVTIFGQSAGAALVNILMYSPKVPNGLFIRAICQSGSFLSKWAYNSNPIDLAKQACIKLNCSLCSNITNINQCLMEASTLKLYRTLANENDRHYTLTIGDKHEIFPTIPSELIKTSTKKYPMIAGVTKHDGSFILAAMYDILKAKYINISQINSHDIIDTIIKLSGENTESGSLSSLAKKLLFTHKQLITRNFTDLIPGLIDLSSILIFKSSVLRLVELHAKLNPFSTYLYTFDYQGQYTRFGYENGNEHYPFNGGVHHSDDNLYIFPKYDLNERDLKIAKKMIKFWTSFASTGIPKFENNESEVIKWQPITTEQTGPYLHIDETLHLDEEFLDEYLVTDKKIIRRNYL